MEPNNPTGAGAGAPKSPPDAGGFAAPNDVMPNPPVVGAGTPKGAGAGEPNRAGAGAPKGAGAGAPKRPGAGAGDPKPPNPEGAGAGAPKADTGAAAPNNPPDGDGAGAPNPVVAPKPVDVGGAPPLPRFPWP